MNRGNRASDSRFFRIAEKVGWDQRSGAHHNDREMVVRRCAGPTLRITQFEELAGPVFRLEVG